MGKQKREWWEMIAEIEYAKGGHQNLTKGAGVQYRDEKHQNWLFGEVVEVDPRGVTGENLGPLIRRRNSSRPNFRLGTFNYTELSKYQPPKAGAKFKLQFLSNDDYVKLDKHEGMHYTS